MVDIRCIWAQAYTAGSEQHCARAHASGTVETAQREVTILPGDYPCPGSDSMVYVAGLNQANHLPGGMNTP